MSYFGDQTLHGSETDKYSPGDAVICGQFTLSEDGDVSHIYVGGHAQDNVVTIRGIIFAADGAGGEAGTAMGWSDETTIDSETPQYWDCPCTTPISLSAGTYWLGGVVISKTANGTFRFMFESGSNDGRDDVSYGTSLVDWDAAGDTEYSGVSLSVYAEYAASGSPTSVGIATETDVAFSVGRSKVLAAGLSAETDVGLVTMPNRIQALGLSTETSAGFATSWRKDRAVGLSGEADLAQAMARSKQRSIGLPSSVESAFATTWAKLMAVGLPTETDTGQPVTKAGGVAVGQGQETDAAFPAGRAKLRVVGLGTEADTALAPSIGKLLVLGLPLETGTAFGIAIGSGVAIGQSQETDAGLIVTRSKLWNLGLATESGAALPVTAARRYGLGLAGETDLAQLVARAKRITLGLASSAENLSATPVSTTSGGGQSIQVSGKQRSRPARGRWAIRPPLERVS